ncbi:AraC family transcriptional regulator [Plantactinospora endophytica]|uniref:AraC family transcriptional regulator n=1 Tax=Plantactinospora endophytica TaxID=673535 RepID=A0ABQ4EA78_9ACTN|nr:AraC family transcriptional regulator [Plantactinospora endophytica]GIG91630.1 AraC family transcriptional regulator [Plantactinospora endophytica]
MLDALSRLLQDVRPEGALFDRSTLRPPWSLRIVEAAPLTLLTMLGGDAWLRPDGGEPIRLRTRDVAMVVGTEPYEVADSPDTTPQVLVHDARRCTTPDGRVVDERISMCRADADPARSTVLLKGTYLVRSSVARRVLTALPRIAVVPADPAGSPTMQMIARELGRDKPGQQVVLDRLLDLLLVATLRDWFDRPGTRAPHWYRAHADPVVGPALRLLHDDPAHPWTVATLAGKVGVSRAALAKRFTELVGQPPMAYLAAWRTCLAADLLRQTDATVDAIARQVGYANGYALSVAFKRTQGVRPSEHRAASRTPVPERGAAVP